MDQSYSRQEIKEKPYEEDHKFMKDDTEEHTELLESEDEAIVKDILDTVKTRNNSEDSEDSGYLDSLFENSNQKDSNDILIENKLAHLSSSEKHLNLQSLGLDRVNTNLFKKFSGIEYLYLQNNRIASLSFDFFSVLSRLKYLDLRSNLLVTLPCSICYHACLEVLLLQNNCIQRVPKELGSLPQLRAIQISHNPLQYPEPSVMRQGPRAVLEFLRREWRHYETSAAFLNRRDNAVMLASAVQITAKPRPHAAENSSDTSQSGLESKRKNKKSVPQPTSKENSETDSAFSSGGDCGQPFKYENINYKNDPVCMYVSKIRPERLKKNIRLPCTEETKETSWSTSQISSQSVSKPIHNTEPLTNQSSSSPPSSISTNKRRRKKLQHYSEILNPYRPFRSCSESLDESRTHAMYLRNLVDIHRKFIASTRNRMLQRMKDVEALGEWRDEYRTLCSTTEKSPNTRLDEERTKNLPFAVYKEFQKMMTRQELVESKVEDKMMKLNVGEAINMEEQERLIEDKMVTIQDTLNKIDAALKSFDNADGLKNSADRGGTNQVSSSNIEPTSCRDRQKYLLQQIKMMQELQSEVKRMAELNETLL